MAINRAMKKLTPAYEHEIVPTVVEAKKRLQSDKYDVAFVDFTLRDGTGFDVFDFMNRTPFVVVTGGGSEQIAVEAIKCGAADYLVKESDQSHLAFLPTLIETTFKNHESEKKLKMLLEAMMAVRDSVFITDLDTRIIYVNEAFLSTYGYREEEIVGQLSKMLWTTPNAGGQPSYGENDFYHKKKNGAVFPVLLSQSSLKDPDGNDVNIITVVHDITERKKMEQALAVAIEKYTALLDRVESENIQLGKAKSDMESSLKRLKTAYETAIRNHL